MAFVDGSTVGLTYVIGSGQGSLLATSATDGLLYVIGTANLLEPAFITEANAISSTQIRVEFSQSVDRTVAIELASNWRVNRLGSGIALVTVASVIIAEGLSITSIDLVTSEMTQGGNYSVQTISQAVTANGIPLAQDAKTFTGIGEAPEILVVVAASATSAQVRFTEAIRNSADVTNPTTYTFDNGLTVEEVLAISGNIVTLKTSEQDPEILYTLTVDGLINDNAMNPLVVPADSPMLGFRTPAEAVQALQLEMYRFLPANLREIDRTKGREFIKRFLDGPQAVWRVINDNIIALLDLWNIAKIRDEHVYLLQDILGWVQRYAAIPNALEPATKRRLLAASAAFWKGRGPEDAIENVIRLTTGARARVLNYFDFRWVVGETHFGEEHDGEDPWLIANSPQSNEAIQLASTVRYAGDATTLQSQSLAMGEADVLLVFTVSKGHRPVSFLEPTPFSTLRHGTVDLNPLGFIEHESLLIEAWWLRGRKSITANLEWQFVNDVAPPDSAWAVIAQTVIDVAKFFPSSGQINGVGTTVNEGLESNEQMRFISVAGARFPLSVATPGESLLVNSIVNNLSTRVSTSAGSAGATGMGFSQGTSGVIGMLSVGLLGKVSGIISGGEQEYQIRVVDDGTLDRELVRNLAKITRPTNERVDIFYVGFLDQFTTDNDKSQWEDEEGVSEVVDGTMVLPADVALESTFVNLDGSLVWSQYSVTWKAAGDTSFDLIFYRASETDHYFVRIITAATSSSGRGTVELWARNANVDSLIDSEDMPEGFMFSDEVYHSVRVEIVRVGLTNSIKVLVDAEVILTATDATHTAGSIGIRRDDAESSGPLTVDDVELFFLPASVDHIDINSN